MVQTNDQFISITKTKLVFLYSSGHANTFVQLKSNYNIFTIQPNQYLCTIQEDQYFCTVQPRQQACTTQVNPVLLYISSHTIAHEQYLMSKILVLNYKIDIHSYSFCSHYYPYRWQDKKKEILGVIFCLIQTCSQGLV